ncbi:hypothetical protein [Paenibacillus sp. 1P07SE]|uniref:hypothetical protein n=1 Tax=Paenibacillus sp. 1P07SE TaxID=3132209 RepID=UPI0039A6D5AA
MRRFSPAVIIVVGLIFIGLIVTLISDPSILIIAAAVFGVIYLLYKFPPDRWFGRKPGSRNQPKVKPSARTVQKMQARTKKPRKKVPFRVIEGGKDDDDNIPKYH